MYNYKKAKNYEQVRLLIESILSGEFKSISDLAIKSTVIISEYLGITTKFEVCSEQYSNTHLSGQDRVLDICKNEQADTYINPMGGIELYSREVFSDREIELMFINSENITYKQFSNEFVPFLSIIDVLMFNDKEQVLKMLNDFELV